MSTTDAHDCTGSCTDHDHDHPSTEETPATDASAAAPAEKHEVLYNPPSRYKCRPLTYTDEEYEAVGIHLLERWPTQDEILIPDLPILAAIKTALLRRDFERAASLLLQTLFDPAIQDSWVDAHVARSMMGFVQGIRFTTDVMTSDINLLSGLVRISPIFFLRFVHNFRDFMELMVHERDHYVLRTLYGLNIYWNEAKIYADEANIAEDAYIQARIRYLLGGTNQDVMQFAIQVENDRVAKALARNRPESAHNIFDKVALAKPTPTELETHTRLTLTTTKYAAFSGPIKSQNILGLIRYVETGKAVNYFDWIRAWKEAFPEREDQQGIRILVCGHSNHNQTIVEVDDDTESNEGNENGPNAGCGGDLEEKELPIIDDHVLIEAICNSLSPADPLSVQLQSVMQHIRWSKFIHDSLVHDIIAVSSSAPIYTARGFQPRITRSSALSLSMGFLPTMYDMPISATENELYALYVDVSGSMDAYYGVVASVSDAMEGRCEVVKQFSTEIVEVPRKNTKLYTTGGTNYDIVAHDIIDNGYRNVIILTDNTCNISEELIGQLHGVNINLISTTQSDSHKMGFNSIAVRRIDLPDAS